MTPPTPPRDTTAGRVHNDLRNLAHRAGRDPAEYMTLYALEGFLARMIASDHARDFVLKGGVLMAAFAARRPTRDIDLAAIGLVNDIPDVEQRVRAIVTTDLADGLLFDTASVAGEPIRDDAPYAGVRVNLTGRLSSARVVLHVDVNFGDPIWPAPTQAVVPLLLGGTLSLPGYPDHMVLAEKIVTAIDRGDQNTRWRDFVDITAITGTRTIRYADLRPAIETVARYRQVEIQPLEELLTAMPDLAQRKWSTWRRKQRIDSAPEDFSQLLALCTAFADPVLTHTAQHLTWDPDRRAWSG